MDVGIAAAATAAALAERAFTLDSPALLPGAALAVVVGGSLAWRRTAPLASYAVGTAALAAESLLLTASAVSPYANLLGVVSLALYGTRNRALWGPVLALAGVAAWFADGTWPPSLPVTVALVWVVAWGVGYQAARRREARELRQATADREAVRAERLRIARDVHDAVGHALSVMLVQVGAARTVLDDDPALARELLHSTERTGAETMADLDRVLGLLRDEAVEASGDATGGRGVGQEHVGLADLDRLVGRLGDAGLRVRLHREPEATDGLPPSADVALYRIAQESLTNALRHGHARTADLRLRRADGDVLLEVTDDGDGPPPGWRPGRGLLGVRERAAVLGGTVEHGPGPDGGFRVAVRLPAEGAR